jgi:hypothetical protein
VNQPMFLETWRYFRAYWVGTGVSFFHQPSGNQVVHGLKKDQIVS